MVKENEETLSQAMGSPMFLKLKGRRYELTPISMGDMADFPQYIKGRRIEVAQDIRDSKRRKAIKTHSINPEKLAMVLRGINNDSLQLEIGITESFVDADREMHTIDGARFLLWKAISIKHPDITLEDMDDLIDLDNIEESTAVLMELGKKPKNPIAEVKKN